MKCATPEQVRFGVGLCIFLAWVGVLLVGDALGKTVGVGDTKEKVVSTYGRPLGEMNSSGNAILLYTDGEVTLREGKVVSDTTGRSATGPTEEPSEAKRERKPSEILGEVPKYNVLASKLRNIARNHGIKVSAEELRKEIDRGWLPYKSGGRSPLQSWKTQVRFARLAKGTKIDFDIEDKAEYGGVIKFKRGGKWEYVRTLPTAEDGVTTCWKKYSYRRRVGVDHSGDTSVEYYMGNASVWYRLQWERSAKCWYWITPSERRKVRAEFKEQLASRAKRAAASRPPVRKGGYTSIREIVMDHGNEFEVRALEEVGREVDRLPWPDP